MGYGGAQRTRWVAERLFVLGGGLYFKSEMSMKTLTYAPFNCVRDRKTRKMKHKIHLMGRVKTRTKLWKLLTSSTEKEMSKSIKLCTVLSTVLLTLNPENRLLPLPQMVASCFRSPASLCNFISDSS